MAKPSKTVYICQECGAQSPKWQGKCLDCGGWNTFAEETIDATARRNVTLTSEALPITQIALVAEDCFTSGIAELDRVLGGGIVAGSLMLVGGAPGIGKSTLMLQTARYIAESGRRTLYISGEESVRQIKRRAERLETQSEHLLLLSETSLNQIIVQIDKVKPQFLIVDSIQSVYREELQSAPGSVSQVRECAHQLMTVAKSRHLSTFLIGHVTKDGAIAGPRVLEHIVDTVLYFEGDQHHLFRILRAVKNRYGSTNEIGVFQMQANGLSEVKNPSELFISERGRRASGSVVVCTLEGNRSLLIEIQALSSASAFGTPQRVATGFDQKRLAILLAVLEKRQGLHIGREDIFLNVAGGMQVDDPAADLGVVCAIASSFLNKVIDPHTVVIGEAGLSGEIRGVLQIEPRLNEAARLGFKRAIIPARNEFVNNPDSGLIAYPAETVSAALALLWE